MTGLKVPAAETGTGHKVTKMTVSVACVQVQAFGVLLTALMPTLGRAVTNEANRESRAKLALSAVGRVWSNWGYFDENGEGLSEVWS